MNMTGSLVSPSFHQSFTNWMNPQPGKSTSFSIAGMEDKANRRSVDEFECLIDVLENLDDTKATLDVLDKRYAMCKKYRRQKFKFKDSHWNKVKPTEILKESLSNIEYLINFISTDREYMYYDFDTSKFTLCMMMLNLPGEHNIKLDIRFLFFI